MMNVLEKILEEIENINYYPEGMGCGIEDCGITDRYEACEYGWNKAIEAVVESIQNMNDATATNDGWIPVEERLPEKHKSMFAKLKGTHMWNNAMFEKVSDEVNVTIELEDGTRKTTTSHTLDGKWKVEKECVVNKKVIAWRPLPEPYKSENTNDNTTKEY